MAVERGWRLICEHYVVCHMTRLHLVFYTYKNFLWIIVCTDVVFNRVGISEAAEYPFCDYVEKEQCQ